MSTPLPTATARALQTPELLDIILMMLDLSSCGRPSCEVRSGEVYLNIGDLKYCERLHRAALFKCALVSRTWSSASLKRLWGFYTGADTFLRTVSNLEIPIVGDLHLSNRTCRLLT